jgi:DNA-directed RNA polymerase subunit alpha
MEQILLPTQIEFQDTDRENVGKMIMTPCHQGYGTTLGNALRRVLLSSLPGAAVESIKIQGVQHEFSAIEGVHEDVIQIILNVKQVAVRSHSKSPVTLSLTKKGIGDVKAGDFEKNADVEIVNPDLKLASITDENKTFEMEITIGQGRGYVPVGEKETKNLDLGTIAIDSLYTPIRDVGYNVEMTRVGDVTDYEKLVLMIETNGTISPKDAVSQSTKILMDHFNLISEATGGIKEEVVESVVEEPIEEVVEEVEEAEEDTSTDDEEVKPSTEAQEKQEKPKKSKKKKSEE